MAREVTDYGTVWIYPGGTLRLADNPVQLQNGTLSGGRPAQLGSPYTEVGADQSILQCTGEQE
jgi:hypothetical protein